MERHSWDQYSDSYGTFREVSETRILVEFHTFLLLLYLATWLRHNMKATLFIALKQSFYIIELYKRGVPHFVA